MPHRVAVLVNENSQASKKAANMFAGLHGVPGCNLIYLDLPESMFSGRFECSPEEFKSIIYEPAVKQLTDRGLSDQILAWVYSVDFPIRVVTADYDRQQMSIMGLTFLRGEVPDDLKNVEFPQTSSFLFVGPVSPGGAKNPPRAFVVSKLMLKEKMPLPSMMLGYIGEKGNRMETVLRCITNGVKARVSNPRSRVLFVKTSDAARSSPREWQFEDVKNELAVRGGSAVITTNLTTHQSDLTGVMTGLEKINPSGFGTFAPGAMAEHLTSFSAEFQKGQSKCTKWLEAGATVTAGMVVEPYNKWVKFPHARFFAHYAAGCSAMESFYQSIASPVQVLLLGDPLSQIAALPVEMKAIGLSKEITSSIDAAFVLDAKFSGRVQVAYSALLNGKEIKPAEGNSLIDLPFDEMGDGYHEVRMIAQAVSSTRLGDFKDISVFINKKGRSIAMTGMTDELPSKITIKAKPEGDKSPTSVYLLWNGQKLVSAAPGENLIFDEKVIGEGPHRIQAVAVYEDGMEVRSEPQGFTIAFNPADQ